MMRDIYQGAMNVLIWLGTEEDQSSFALSSLESLGERGAVILADHDIALETFTAPVGKGGGRMRAPVMNVMDRLHYAFRAALQVASFDEHRWLSSIGALLRRPWWSRSWTQQEMVLARFPVVLCGPTQACWDDVSLGLYLLIRYYEELQGVQPRSEDHLIFHQI